MKLLLGQDQRGPLAASALVLGALTLLAVTVLANARVTYVAPALAVLVLLAIAWRALLSWRSLLAMIVLLIYYIPIRRYEIPANLPFTLEPYRIFVAFLGLGWIASLLADPRVRLRKTGIDKPFLLFGAAIVASLIANPGRYVAYSSLANKEVMFFATFFVVFYVVASTLRDLRVIDFVINWLVGGSAVLAIFAVIEYRTNYNFFNHLSGYLPLKLNPSALPEVDYRGGHVRAAASAQHPIALGAAFSMLIPLGVYTMRRSRQARWRVATVLIALGALASGSRTAIIMMVPIALVFLWLKPRETKRFWPALLPMVLVIHFAAPGALGTIMDSFFPQGGLLTQEKKNRVGSGRLATLGPVLSGEVMTHPLLGTGFGTRVTKNESGFRLNAPITDNEWLSVLAETGLAGALALAWTFVRFVRMLGRAAKNDTSPKGWLLVSIAASVAAYAIGMLTYDAFSFIQVTFLAFILLGLGCSVRRAHGATTHSEPLLPQASPSRGGRPRRLLPHVGDPADLHPA